jgi:tRNA-uridine 2-sulfurtransferase
MAKILSAMSGGVDSSAATALLIEQGHDVVGAYMKNWINEDEIVGHCPWQQDIEDARAVAEQLDARLQGTRRELPAGGLPQWHHPQS